MVFDFCNEGGLPISVKKVPFYNDEPKVFQFEAEFYDADRNGEPTLGYGSDFDRNGARAKAVYEAIERACLMGAKDAPVVQQTVAKLPPQFIDPRSFQPFTDGQLKSKRFQGMRIVEDSEFSWLEGIDALTCEKVWLPAQLVRCPYKLASEPVIRFPSSNGAALGYTKNEACSRAVLEIIERDAYMCWYLTSIPAQLIDLTGPLNSEELHKIYAIYRRYGLELYLVRLSTPWPFAVVVAIILDYTGVGPEVRIGMKCDPQLARAVKGAVAEAQQMRPWLRDAMHTGGLPTSIRKNEVVDAWSRALYWAMPGRRRELSPLLTSALESEMGNWRESTEGPTSWDAVWDLILSVTKANEMDLYLVDIGGAISREFGFKVFKALVPQAHPVYMDERFPYLSSECLRSVQESFGPRWGLDNSNRGDQRIPPHPFS